MSGNPFPSGDNPFSDPSVRQAQQRSQGGGSGFDDYNPFAASNQKTPYSQPARGASNPPPTMAASESGYGQQPPPYSSAAGNQQSQAYSEELLRKQRELEAKEEAIRRREEELNRLPGGARPNNFPPLPKWAPCQPCFYHDIQLDIPDQFQQVVKTLYYIWIAYSATLLANVIGSLAYFASGGSGSQFGLSLLQLVMFTPCSYVLWYRPLYKAFKTDSSMQFMIFFFIFFAQTLAGIIFSLGFIGWSCGIISSIDAGKYNRGVQILMFCVTFCFVIETLAMAYMLIKVHRIYRSTGASFAKAQEEFSHGIISNQHVQQAATHAAGAAVRSQFGGDGAGGGGGGGRF